MRVSAASTAAVRSTGALSLAGATAPSGCASSPCIAGPPVVVVVRAVGGGVGDPAVDCRLMPPGTVDAELLLPRKGAFRSEEHTSELQSLMRISYAVFCLKKKTTQTIY